MHEMSIAVNLLEIAEAEAAAKKCARILALTVHYGQISGIMPEALRMAFEALVAGGIHAGARLELVELPLLLRCPFCQQRFKGLNIFQACPGCGEEFGHIVEQGRELILARIEAI